MTQTLVVPQTPRLCLRGLQKLWIIDRQTGICLFEQTFAKPPREVDSDLIGGFLTAISKFCEELVGEEIASIRTQNLQILYHAAEKFVVIVLLPNNINNEIAQSMLNEISILFVEKYAGYLDAGKLANVSVFQDFAVEMEHLYNAKTACFIRYFIKNKHLKKERHLVNLFANLKRTMEKQRSAAKTALIESFDCTF